MLKWLATFIILFSNSPVSAEFLSGKAAAERGEFAKALSIWILSAGNDARSQNAIGQMYQFGTGVAEGKVEAVKWYRLAAEQGNENGQVNLSYMYYNALCCTNRVKEVFNLTPDALSLQVL